MEEKRRKVRDEIMGKKEGRIPSVRETLSTVAGGEGGEGSRELNEGGLKKQKRVVS